MWDTNTICIKLHMHAAFVIQYLLYTSCKHIHLRLWAKLSKLLLFTLKNNTYYSSSLNSCICFPQFMLCFKHDLENMISEQNATSGKNLAFYSASHNPDGKTSTTATAAWFQMMPENSWYFQSTYLMSDSSLHLTWIQRNWIRFPKEKVQATWVVWFSCHFINPELCCPVVV